MINPMDTDGKDLLDEFLHPEKGGNTFPTREEMWEELARSRFHKVVMKDMNLTDEERIAPDTYGCECIFLRTFITPKMSDDFSLIAKDFLKHEFSNLDEHEMTDYLDYDDAESLPDRIFEKFILNLMMNAVNAGSEYARNLFCYLHKTYYKQEYKQLKRFNRLSYDDVRTLANDGVDRHFPFNIARILSMAKMYGIEIAPENSFNYLMLTELNDGFGEDPDPVGFDREEIDSNIDKIREIFSDNEIDEMYVRSDELVDECLDHYGYKPGYTWFCNDEIVDLDDCLGIALHLLEENYPEKEDFTPEEIFLCAQLYAATGALTVTVDRMAERMKEVVYGKRGTDYYDYFKEDFNPEMVGGVLRREKPQKVELKEPTVINKNGISEEKEKLLMDEINTLRRKLHEQETMIRQLKADMADKGKLQEKLTAAQDKNENDQKELAALRDHLYHMTEDDEQESSVSVDDMKSAIADKKIVIIGGHTNWTNKMKSMFPKWDYVKPSATSAQDTSVLMKADKVYFFTDTISHSTYYRYVNVCREHKVLFGYIHGVNTDTNVRQVYREMGEEV